MFEFCAFSTPLKYNSNWTEIRFVNVYILFEQKFLNFLIAYISQITFVNIENLTLLILEMGYSNTNIATVIIYM